jgi:hypothetical protein
MKRDVNSTKVLSPDDKKYLKKVSNYLNSLGMQDGTIELDFSGERVRLSDVNIEDIGHFSNKYSAEIPSGLVPILQKIINYIDVNDLYQQPDEDINYERLEIDIDTKTKEISVSHWYSYYDRGNENSVEFDSQEDLEQFDGWVNDEFATIDVPETGILTLRYNGGGDSGYIDSSFEENGDAVPAGIEDWCYRELSNNFGGWEINEGSDGEFIFDFNNSMVTLNHTMNTEENDVNTIYEESFGD